MQTIPATETLEVEFKSDVKCYPDHDLIEEIVGMANTVGGVLYLGVEDNGEITGVHKKHRDAIGVTALIANSTVPPISVRAEIIKEEDKDVLKIEVPRSRGIASTSSGKILRRRLKLDGTPETIPMYSYEIPSRLSELGMLDFSLILGKGANQQIWDMLTETIRSINDQIQLDAPHVSALVFSMIACWICTVTIACLSDVICTALLYGKKGNLIITFVLFLALNYGISKLLTLVPASIGIIPVLVWQGVIALALAGVMYVITARLMEKYLSV